MDSFLIDGTDDQRPVMLFFQDEGRFGRISNVQTCWTAPKDKPIINRQFVREFIYAYCSVCPQTGESYSLILPHSNTEMMNIYLNELSHHYQNYRVVLCLDKAGWHTSGECIVPENIKLWFLPPYSPELNPVEIIWRHIRKKHFNNLLFNSMESVINELEIALKEVNDDKESTKSLTLFKWLY